MLTQILSHHMANSKWGYAIYLFTALAHILLWLVYWLIANRSGCVFRCRVKFDVVEPQSCIFVPHSLHTTVCLLADCVKVKAFYANVMIQGTPGGRTRHCHVWYWRCALHTWRMRRAGYRTAVLLRHRPECFGSTEYQNMHRLSVPSFGTKRLITWSKTDHATLDWLY